MNNLKSILIIEDEKRMREILRAYLELDGYKVSEAADGPQALEIFAKESFDLVLLDLMIPVIDGYTVCREIRKTSKVPLIMITAKSEENDKLLGYQMGADDYVTKPFSPKVMVAKIKAVLGRYEGKESVNNQLVEYGILGINRLAYEVFVDGVQVYLSPKEYELLIYLVDNAEQVLDRGGILNKVWGYDYFGDVRTVDTHIKKLRGKLLDASCYIKTVIRVGYKFEVK